MMTLTEKLSHKRSVHNLCLEMLEARIAICQLAIDNAQQASNEEEKSSAGDKFETSRAMNHLEKEMYGKQLQSNLQERAALQAISLDSVHDIIKPGSFVVCKDFDFYIAAGLGRSSLEGRTIYLLSPEAPLAGLLHNKTKGDVFIFNKQEEKIKDVY
jgi:hypothetical protein